MEAVADLVRATRNGAAVLAGAHRGVARSAPGTAGGQRMGAVNTSGHDGLLGPVRRARRGQSGSRPSRTVGQGPQKSGI